MVVLEVVVMALVVVVCVGWVGGSGGGGGMCVCLLVEYGFLIFSWSGRGGGGGWRSALSAGQKIMSHVTTKGAHRVAVVASRSARVRLDAQAGSPASASAGAAGATRARFCWPAATAAAWKWGARSTTAPRVACRLRLSGSCTRGGSTGGLLRARCPPSGAGVRRLSTVGARLWGLPDWCPDSMLCVPLPSPRLDTERWSGLLGAAHRGADGGARCGPMLGSMSPEARAAQPCSQRRAPLRSSSRGCELACSTPLPARGPLLQAAASATGNGRDASVLLARKGEYWGLCCFTVSEYGVGGMGATGRAAGCRAGAAVGQVVKVGTRALGAASRSSSCSSSLPAVPKAAKPCFNWASVSGGD